MKTTTLFSLTLAALIAAAVPGQACGPYGLPVSHAKQQNADKQTVDICFLLDTTGSMGGLIAGAKRKIWSIASEIAESQPAELRFGLVAYRDRGDDYITQITPLTTDLDEINAQLSKLQAGGGGDGPESVNQALYDGIEKMSWKSGDKAKRIIFLVGDAPPHMDYKNDVQYPALCEIAKRKGILINTLLCGTNQEARTVWEKIAQNSSGAFAAIPQDGGTMAVATPFDKEINRISIELNGTAIAYGEASRRENLNRKAVANGKASSESQAARASYAAKNFRGKVMSGNDDLVAEWKAGNILLADIEQKKLPIPLRTLAPAELEQTLKANQVKREKLQTELKKQVAQRDAFLKKAAEEAPKDSFDSQISEILGKQL